MKKMLLLCFLLCGYIATTQAQTVTRIKLTENAKAKIEALYKVTTEVKGDALYITGNERDIAAINAAFNTPAVPQKQTTQEATYTKEALKAMTVSKYFPLASYNQAALEQAAKQNDCTTQLSPDGSSLIVTGGVQDIGLATQMIMNNSSK